MPSSIEQSDVRMLYHITTREEAESAAARGEYVPQAFDLEGFIHCSHSHQVLGTANRLFRGQGNLVLLEIDRERVPHAVIEETSRGATNSTRTSTATSQCRP